MKTNTNALVFNDLFAERQGFEQAYVNQIVKSSKSRISNSKFNESI